MAVTEVKKEQREALQGYIDLLWRQRIFILIPFVAGIFISLLLILFLPKIYRSTTMILVEAQKVPEEYVKSAVSSPVEGRLSTIQQQIMSRSLIQKIIDRFELNKGGLEGTPEDLIEQMRKNIEVKTVGTRNVDAFSLSFQGKDPVTVMNVTNELASLFIEENLKIREQLVEGTSEFLDNELGGMKQALERQENKIGEFKRSYMGELPQQLEANLRALDRFQADLQATQLSRKAAEDRKMLLEKTFEMTRQGESDTSSSAPLAAPESSLSPLMQKWVQKKRALSSLQREYKDNYPDIIILKQELQEIEDQMAGTEKSTPLREERVKGKQKVEMESPYILDLRRQVQTSEAELKALRERERTLEEQIRVYEKRVEKAPAREQELAILLRDYENTKKNYDSLLDKKLNAKISENLEKRQKGEQFRILDSANLPVRPFKPEPFKVGLMGVLLGLGVGVGLAFVREQLDTSIRKPEEVERITSVPVLVSIPDFTEEMRIADGVEIKGAVDERSREKTIDA